MIRKFTLACAALILSAFGVQAQTTIAENGFEGTPIENWSFTNNPAVYNISGDVWDIVTSVGGTVSGPSQGTSFWGMRDLENPNGGGAFPHQLDFAPVDVSGYSNVEVTFDYITEGYDSSDSLVYYVEFDNGSTWTSSSITLNPSTQAWTPVVITVPGGSNFVRVRIEGVQNGGSDYAGVDNFKVTGTGAVTGDITPPEVTDWSFVSATEVRVAFSEPVEVTTAENIANYMVNPGNLVSAASLVAQDTVVLTLSSALMAGTQYTADIMNVVDTSANANALVPFNASFLFNDYSGSDLVITEIFYNQPNGGDIEYFELYNNSSAAIELGGLSITNGVDLDINAPFSLGAGEYMVFIQDSTDFNGVFTVPTTQQIEWTSGSLSNSGEEIEISNSLGQVVVGLEYDDRTPWEPRPDGDGYSLILCDVNSDISLAGSWSITNNVAGNDGTQDLFGSPAAANSCATIPMYEIGLITTVDGSGAADSAGVICEIQGLVAAPNFSANGASGPDVEFQVINNDNTEGILAIAFVGTDVINYIPTMGDEVIIRGEVGQFNGVTQFNIMDVELISTGNCLPFPQLVEVPAEEHESEIIELRNVYLVDNSWLNPAGNGRNYQVVTTNDDTVVVRVRDLTNIDSAFIAGISGNFNLMGMGSEFNGDHQVWPRFQNDFDFDVVKPAPAGLVINELMSSNDTTYADENNEFDDWIELYNGGTTDIDIAGMYISDDSAEPMKYRIPTCDNNTTIAAGGYMVIWADNEEDQGALHTNFSLSASGEFVGLYTADGTTVADSVTFGAFDQDKSFGRRTDGANDWVVFEATTPNASNNSGVVLNVIANSALNNALSVYPNPVQNEVFFNKTVDVQIFTITGKLVKEVKAVNTLNVSDFNNGVYLIRTAEGETVRLIKK